MKRLLLIALALVFGVSLSSAQPGSGNGTQSGKSAQLKTKIQDRKQLRKRDSTGVYHEQNVKERAARQKANRSAPGTPSKGNRNGQAKRQGQGGPK